MMIEVPLFIQTNQFNCGSSCLKMVLGYFGEHYGLEILEKRMGVAKEKGVNSIQIVFTCAELGYDVVFYSKHIRFNEENNELDFYQKYNDLDASKLNVWIEKAEKNGAVLIEKGIDLAFLLSNVSENSIPIVLLDWNIVTDKGEGKYQGHFVPVVGYDSKFVYVHNGGYNDHKANIPIERGVFEKARKAPGTDEDAIIIFRKGTRPKVLKEKQADDAPKDNSAVEEDKAASFPNEMKKELVEEKKELTKMQNDMEQMKKKIDLLKEKLKNKT